MMKGQTSMIAIVIGVVLVIFLMLFILITTLPSGSSTARAEYRQLFATNMLLSVLNTETDCGSFSDMIKASYFGGGKCAGTEFGERIVKYMPDLLYLSGHTDYAWQIVATPKNFVDHEESWGDDTVTETRGYWTALTHRTWGGSILEVKIYMRTK